MDTSLARASDTGRDACAHSTTIAAYTACADGAHAGTSIRCQFLNRKPTAPTTDTPLLHLESPFSLKAALKYGCIFLILQVVVVLAQQALGQVGVYATSVLGGFVSSSSAVAAAASLSSQGSISTTVAGISAVIASLTSVAINLPLIMRTQQQHLTWRFTWAIGIILLFGITGTFIQRYAVTYLLIGT